jgi:hypothetical protein
MESKMGLWNVELKLLAAQLVAWTVSDPATLDGGSDFLFFSSATHFSVLSTPRRSRPFLRNQAYSQMII